MLYMVCYASYIQLLSLLLQYMVVGQSRKENRWTVVMLIKTKINWSVQCLVGAEVLKYLCNMCSPPFPSFVLPMPCCCNNMMVECMASDNPQQPPHELQIAEVESRGSMQTVQVPLRSYASGSPKAGGSAVIYDHHICVSLARWLWSAHAKVLLSICPESPLWVLRSFWYSSQPLIDLRVREVAGSCGPAGHTFRRIGRGREWTTGTELCTGAIYSGTCITRPKFAIL